MRNILVFTDSRGQHKPSGSNHPIFAERLRDELPDTHVDIVLCPMKWTTTLDFLQYAENNDLSRYEWIILYTGIVEWSPRPASSAYNDLYANTNEQNLDALHLNTRDYSKKIVNNKKIFFDRLFGETEIQTYLTTPFDVEFLGEPTINMYSLEMARSKICPRLSQFHNLIFVNSNRILSDWAGDHKKGRPRNMAITHQYSDVVSQSFPPERLVDISTWSESEIKHYTCDNMHLTKEGSDYIFSQILAKINSTQTNTSTMNTTPVQHRNDSILVIGNGPSTRKLIDYGLSNLPDGLDTFGMGAAYRYFEEVDWWPTYYAWCDMKVVHSHFSEFKRIVESPNIATTTRKFFFSLPVSKSDTFEQIPHGSTGDFCFRKAAELGYKNIYIIGVEGNYVEEISESRPLDDDEYKNLGFDQLFQHFENIVPDKKEAYRIFRDNLRIIKETPTENPNYFFDSYQRKGDVFSLPRSQTHRNAWKKSVTTTKQDGVHFFNLSESSQIENIPKLPWPVFLNRINNRPDNAFSPYGRPIDMPRVLTREKREALLAMTKHSASDKLACLIIGVRLKEHELERIRNLQFLLGWIDKYYGDLFDVLLVEQDEQPRALQLLPGLKNYVRHEFLYNPRSFNRGWGYNVAARRFTDAQVMALMDTDVLTGANFANEIVSCHLQYKAISPYMNVYFADEAETDAILAQGGLSQLVRKDGVKKPTTITGGILIARRAVFLEVAGFEQYIEYAGEDRALDVTLLNHCAKSELRMAPFTYVHLHHPTSDEPRPRAKELFKHLNDNFGCKVNPTITPEEDIHKNCKHVSKEVSLKHLMRRKKCYGDPHMYKNNPPEAINGVPPGETREGLDSIIFPPAFKGLDKYEANETYKAPEPDTKRLAGLYNAFKGERCFIVGNGPSLNQHNLDLLDGEYVFAVNSIYYKTKATGFRPTFFVVEDSSVMTENIEEIKIYQAPYKFFPTNYKSIHPEADNVFFFRMNRGFYEKSSPNYCIPRFSTDASKQLYCGQSVTYINLQLAHFMGFVEVYLIGMDFSYQIPDSHQRTGDLILSTTDDPNHFHKDYFGKGKTWKDPKLERVALNYTQAKLAYESTGRRIYNATIGGHLDIFDRVDYNTLLGGTPAPLPRDGVSFSEANSLYRQGRYNEALAAYISLARRNSAFTLYKRNALHAYQLASSS
ncbi:6-hydroxymethylpterin diphosphokinase MptE-like protein, partial [Accumulibacter sp.]|uniref:6-hydroxymethylpterin diphosphokinase MptE-like protein n=1 Tax=Accumulibacter sp. TaxID=2053492 RepID=UPI0025D48A55